MFGKCRKQLEYELEACQNARKAFGGRTKGIRRKMKRQLGEDEKQSERRVYECVGG